MKVSKLKDKRKLLIGLIFIIYLLISMQTASFGVTGEVVYGGSISWNGSTVGKFAVNDQVAFCIDHSKPTPPGGTELNGEVSTNSDIIKCLYYGWGGLEEWSGFASEAQGIVQTTLALDYYINGNTHHTADSFINYIESESIPQYKLNFSNSNLKATLQGNKQVTNSTTIQGNNDISMTLTLQDDVTVVCENMGWSQTGGSVTISAGDVLHFEAPLTVNGTWVSADIVNSTYKFQSIIYSTGSNSYQRLGGSLTPVPDPISSINLTINWLDVGGFKVIAKNVKGDLVQGKTFHIWNDDGFDTSKVTNALGEIILEDVDPGTYYIKETAVPSGYTVNPNTYNITVNAGDTPDTKNITITNEEPTGTITITKTNTNGDKVPNVQFLIIAKETIKNTAGTKTYYTAGQIVATITTNANGEATKSGLPLGKYTIKETQVPSGYLLNTEQKDVTLSYKDQNTSVVYGTTSFVNEEPTGTITITKTNTNGDKVPNVQFLIIAKETIKNKAGTKTYYTARQIVATITTNANGEATKSGLPLGKYTIKETQTPLGYLLNTEQKDVTLSYKDQNTSVVYGTTSFVNQEPTGTITLTKEDETTNGEVNALGEYLHGDVSIEGAVYTLYADEIIKNAAGTMTYINKDEAVANFTFDETGKATISILKNIKGLQVSGNRLKGLPLGKYYVKETVTPEGYVTDETKHSYIFSYTDSITAEINISDTIEETIKREPFEIIKISSITNDTAKLVKNAEFTVMLKRYIDYYGSLENALLHTSDFRDDEWGVYTTDSRGYLITDRLAFGTYFVRETRTPEGLNRVKDFLVTLSNNSITPTQNWRVENDIPFTAYVKMIKKDKNTGNNVTFSNATFKIYKYNETTGEYDIEVKCKVGKNYYSSWTTDNEGNAYTETKLEYGKYKLVEIGVPKGYNNQIEEEIKFTLSASNSTCYYDEDSDAWVVVIVENEQPTGTIIVNKTIETTEEKDTTLISEIDYTKIKFNLIAEEDIINYEDGSIIYNKDKIIGTYSLDINGKLQITNLPLGKYKLVEIATIDGLVLDSSSKEIYFIKIDNTTKNYYIEQNIVNNTTVFEFSKTDIKGKELAGAKLQVIDENGNIIDEWISTNKSHKIEGLIVGRTYTLHEEVAPNGYVKSADIKFKVENTKELQKIKMIDRQVTVIKIEDQNNKPLTGAKLQVIDENGNIIDEWVTDENKHYISGLIEGHKYIIKEIEAPKDYIIAEPITFIAGEENKIQEYTMIDKLDLITITITKIAKQTSASGKYQKGQSLANCTFTIYDEDGNILKVVTTDETGSITFNLLRGYKYTIKETQAPEEYLNDSEPQEIYLDDRVTSLSLEFYNNPIILELDISKIGIRQAQPNDIIRYDFPNLINKSNVYLDNFTWKDTLPYEYVKITKLYTGTYNEDLDYKVYYKLNTDSEYKQFGNIYNTLQNNCIDFESLGLDNINTYVTEFKIVFGTVKPGFSAIDTPFIFTKVDDDVTKNDEWINKTKLTGDYTDQFGNKTELSDEDNWKTISYSAKLNVTNKKSTITKLPRTGNELPFIYNISKISLLIISILGIIIVSKINKKQNLN